MNIIGLIIVGTIYFILLDFLSFIFSIRLCGTMNALTSDNFECGFYSILTSSLRYRFNYWMIIIHFVIYEQELILALLWIYSITINLNSNNLCCLLLSILFMELMLNYVFIISLFIWISLFLFILFIYLFILLFIYLFILLFYFFLFFSDISYCFSCINDSSDTLSYDQCWLKFRFGLIYLVFLVNSLWIVMDENWLWITFSSLLSSLCINMIGLWKKLFLYLMILWVPLILCVLNCLLFTTLLIHLAKNWIVIDELLIEEEW